jgi:hypothetical protein
MMKRQSLISKEYKVKQTLVRESNLAGSCIVLGRLVRETDRFFIYHRRRVGDQYEEAESRIAKRRRMTHGQGQVHIEPCRLCEDHPHTYYPDRYAD